MLIKELIKSRYEIFLGAENGEKKLNAKGNAFSESCSSFHLEHKKLPRELFTSRWKPRTRWNKGKRFLLFAKRKVFAALLRQMKENAENAHIQHRQRNSKQKPFDRCAKRKILILLSLKECTERPRWPLRFYIPRGTWRLSYQPPWGDDESSERLHFSRGYFPSRSRPAQRRSCAWNRQQRYSTWHTLQGGEITFVIRINKPLTVDSLFVCLPSFWVKNVTVTFRLSSKASVEYACSKWAGAVKMTCPGMTWPSMTFLSIMSGRGGGC